MGWHPDELKFSGHCPLHDHGETPEDSRSAVKKVCNGGVGGAG